MTYNEERMIKEIRDKENKIKQVKQKYKAKSKKASTQEQGIECNLYREIRESN